MPRRRSNTEPLSTYKERRKLEDAEGKARRAWLAQKLLDYARRLGPEELKRRLAEREALNDPRLGIRVKR